MKQSPIQSASLHFNEEGTPVSREFDDVYFSNDNGLEETRYVFLTGNRIPTRFAAHPRPLFIVAESGFGTGLNFLTLWQAFTRFRQQQPQAALQRLHFISFEKYPLTRRDLALAHQRWPELAPWADELQQQWPEPFAGCHRLLLDGGRVTLDLWFGDINDTLSQLDDSANQQVDAWFLDGFAPAKNPDMWTPALFNAMARLARPGGSVATFTSAGFVRRGLQEAGFTMRKQKGFGRKREMLTGSLERPVDSAPRSPWYLRRAASAGGEIALVGGGIASALLSLALLRRGWRVTLYCADDAPAQGASGNRQGALYPLLSHADDTLTGFFTHAFSYARRLYDSLPVAFDHQWCGVTQLAWDEKSRHKIDQMLALGLPETIAHGLSAQQVAERCGLETHCGAITYPMGGWLCPAQLTTGAIALASSQGLQVQYHKRVQKLANQSGWTIDFADGNSAHHEVLVLANGWQISQFAWTEMLPVYPVGGQVSHIPTTRQLAQLTQVLCYDGYLTPHHPQRREHCIGASYHRGVAQITCNAADQLHNRQRLIDCLPQARWTYDVDISAGEARCGVRCATRDHLPLVGQAPDYPGTLTQYATLRDDLRAAKPIAAAPALENLYLLGALGSRGLCSAPLAAEILAAQISGEPLPAGAATLAALSPNRYWIRKLLKGKPVIV
ncbi:bifunctional tRNA (5-methylaminomethyl-2-thiouridine)(34)-methyltransferase MnmD/FAD-dependent 5-carboxymethylaminomethyl-2-thiouridine(34) oxidoreductase MnmC [Entomohabitans teleogrylli]|uniref:bifunctional tRNA (5-methylaminomethyl-2-thiouridine)(34)-methyltransferase MnmD/FAD-dependent 5-carboxymethylaminomethyl-2-thiouridine(34) oxidoreductase MnmC n=1 Tax=Entomohabitans teleogrylli TaxID=1384589 RepID=UPI00073D1D19|nr:bifunctional tRNA (5-methylaminomethyl-2-thiouridine)(34)-methyltransferase MnmD/FAD-dependent 5-carboxymethylaminomethyl-2-thiouridine(34) oxidoreductase MnmC [Entomohabitans teleogrylli]